MAFLQRSSNRNVTVSVGISLVILILVLAKGGNSNWVRAVLTVFGPLLFIWANFLGIGRTWMNSRQLLIAWVVPWLAVSLCVIVQTIPIELGFHINSVLKYCPDQDFCKELALSNYPAKTVSFWAVFSSYWLVAAIVSALNYRDIRLITTTIVVLAVFQSIYGLVALAGGQQTILGIWEKEYFIGHATGTFVNRNHYSGFLEISWPIGLSLILVLIRSFRFRFRSAAQYFGLAIFSLLIAVAVFSSHSRLGAASAIAGVVIWLILLSRIEASTSNQRKPLNFKWIAVILIIFVLLGSVWFGIDRLLDRLLALSLDQGRFLIWRATMDYPLTTWLFGAGAGSFLDTFRTVQPPELHLFYDYAHNDFLEFVLDFGIVGTGLIAGAGGYWLIKVFPERLSTLQAGALAGICSILVHGTGDFNLHIPGVAITFWVAVGILSNPNSAYQRRKSRTGNEVTP